jgi:hypothetical protein
LTGPSGKGIPCWGEQRMELSFHGHRLVWTFLLADVQFAIIEVDFLRSHQLSIPWRTAWCILHCCRKVNRAVADLEVVFAYVDDMDLASKDAEEHAFHLR